MVRMVAGDMGMGSVGPHWGGSEMCRGGLRARAWVWLWDMWMGGAHCGGGRPLSAAAGQGGVVVVCRYFFENSEIFGARHQFQKCIIMILFSMFPNKTSKIQSKSYF